MKSLFTIKSGGAASWAMRLAVAAVLAALMLWVPTRGSDSLIEVCTTAFTLMAAALSLNLLLGYAGQISLGHSAFFGIGTYTTAVMVTRWGWSPFHTLPVAFVLAFVVGVLVSLPALRIKGVYLALVTLALGMVFPQFIKWKKLSWLTGGAKGINDTGFKFTKDNPTYEIFGWNPWGNLRGQNVKPFYFWVGAIIVLVVYLICRGVVKSRVGRSLVAIRDNSTAAAVMGVNLPVTKGIVFGLSAAMCALPGSLSAIRTGLAVGADHRRRRLPVHHRANGRLDRARRDSGPVPPVLRVVEDGARRWPLCNRAHPADVRCTAGPGRPLAAALGAPLQSGAQAGRHDYHLRDGRCPGSGR